MCVNPLCVSKVTMWGSFLLYFVGVLFCGPLTTTHTYPHPQFSEKMHQICPQRPRNLVN